MTDIGRLTIGIAIILATGPPVRGDLLFYASYDSTRDADVAVGDGKAIAKEGDPLPELTTEEHGRFGRALNARDPGKGRGLRYDTAGNIDLTRGTIEFFGRLGDFGDEKPAHRYFTLTGPSPFLLGVGPRPNGQGMVLGYSWNGRNGWDYYSEKFLGVDRWQHIAVTWDMSGGKGRGTLSVFVEGVRQIHATNLDPYDSGLEFLSVGGRRNSRGYLDDFAVFNDVRYERNFPPRQRALGELAETALAKKTRGGKAPGPVKVPLGNPSLQNGGFEQWVDGKPVGWRLQKGEMYPDQTMKMQGRRSLAILVDRKEKHPWPHSLISSDPFVLEPHSQYRLSAWVTSSGSVGDLRFEVHGSEAGVVGSYRSGWTRSHPWLEINQTFRTRESRQYQMSVWSQSGFGWPVWIDEIKIEKIGAADVEAAPGAGGVQLFSRSVMESLDIDQSLPAASELIDSLQINLARGEYEPGLVGLHALRNLSDVDLVGSGDLVAADGSTIAGNDVTIRRLQGAVLPLSRPRSIDSGDIIAWWVTARADMTCPAGVYRGTLKVTAAGQVIRELPLEVEVMDIDLPEPDIAFLIYHHEHYIAAEFLTPELQQAYYRDMREHGMNTVTVYNNADVDGSAKVDFAHNYGYKPEDPRFAVGLDTQLKWILASGLGASGQPVLWLPSGHGYGWGGVPEPALRATLETWKSRGWPTPLLYVNDEPGGEGPRAEAALKRLKLIKSWDVPVRTTTAGLDPDVLGRYYDVWIEGDGAITLETLQKANKLSSELWTYNCTCPHDNMPFCRAFYGFLAFRTGVKGVAQWAYYDNKLWTADADGNPGGNPRTRLSRVCVSPNGPIPTLSWEAMREGIDDYRYAQRLRSLITEAGEKLARLSSEAEQHLGKEDRETIDKREQQRLARSDRDKPPITWEPADASQAASEKAHLWARKLRESLEAAKRALSFVIDTIPFDAMVTRGYLSYHAPRWTRYSPPLGPAGLGEDPRTVTEARRRVITSYILALQEALQEP